MSPINYRCHLCGAPVGAERHLWLNEFRGVYTNGHEWFTSHLTGVGLRPSHRSSADLVCPSSPSGRYDDATFAAQETEKVRFGSSPLFRNYRAPIGPESDAIPVERQPWGFVFHEACWILLNEAAYPHTIDANVPKQFFMSCPTKSWLVDWGHDYGGIYERSPSWTFGDDGTLGSLKGFYTASRDDNSRVETYRYDPIRIPEISGLINEPNVQDWSNAESIAIPQRELSDPFALLPREVFNMVLVLLPSKDVLNLKLASRFAAASPLWQPFWASRFRGDFEFPFAFEIRNVLESRSRQNGRALYEGVKNLAEKPSIRNRNKIWKLLSPLADALRAVSSTSLKGDLAPTFYDPCIDDDTESWMLVGGHLNESKTQLRFGCRALYSRTVSLSTEFIGVCISFVHVAGQEYISGIRFKMSNGSSTELGRIMYGDEIFTPFGTERIREIRLAVGVRGIHGILFILDSGKITPWVGHHERLMHGRLNIASRGIDRRLKGYFDGFKFVSLGTPKGGDDIPYDLRDLALWHPEIPKDDLFLNENYFHDVKDARGQKYFALSFTISEAQEAPR